MICYLALVLELAMFQHITKINEVLTMLSMILTIFSMLVGIILVIFYYVDLSPKVDLQIEPTWVGSKNEFLKLRLMVKNISRIRLHKYKCLVQVLEYNFPTSEKCLSEWIPFKPIDNGEPKQIPKSWVTPVEIFQTTKNIEPGETISGDRLYYFPNLEVSLKIGLKFRGHLNCFAKLAHFLKRPQETWTITRIVVKDNQYKSI